MTDIRGEGTPLVVVLPRTQVPDLGHVLGFESSGFSVGLLLTDGHGDEDCWLCQRGICVGRYLVCFDGGSLLIHGAFEC